VQKKEAGSPAGRDTILATRQEVKEDGQENPILPKKKDLLLP